MKTILELIKKEGESKVICSFKIYASIDAKIREIAGKLDTTPSIILRAAVNEFLSHHEKEVFDQKTVEALIDE